MGAGVIPFSVHRGEVLFLFQESFSGRKVGHLIDFGGGGDAGECYRRTAAREFVEETETMYFAEDLGEAWRSPERVAAQLRVVEQWFDRTLDHYPHWWRRRHPGEGPKPKDWRSYFIEFPYRDVNVLNRTWESDTLGRFKKRRLLSWVPAGELLALYRNAPGRLWKRVRELEDAPGLVEEIRARRSGQPGLTLA